MENKYICTHTYVYTSFFSMDTPVQYMGCHAQKKNYLMFICIQN